MTRRPDLPFLLLLLALSAFYLRGLGGVPFHPDESTQLFMSADFEAYLAGPAALAWDAGQAGDLRAHYRLLDAPLTRYWVGLGRLLAGLEALPADWDWTQDWGKNDRRGALPGADLLFAGRVGVVALFPFSMYFLYRSGSQLAGRPAGWAAALLYGSHALILLHTRRAMAEGPLLFGITAFLAALPQTHRRPGLAGLAAALAFNAKQSALPLLLAGLLAVVWKPSLPAGEAPAPPGFGAAVRSRQSTVLSLALLQYFGAFVLVTLALNPFLWRQPAAAFRAALQARRELLAGQVADVTRLAPGQVLDSPGEQLAGLLVQLYLAPPMFAEAGNYRPETGPGETAYLANPFLTLGRGLAGGGLLLGLTLVGLYRALRAAWTRPIQRRTAALFLVAGGLQAGGLLLAVPLAWQRYYLPLVPFVCLWAGGALAWISSSLWSIGINHREHGEHRKF
jgi:hypothetical protein